MLTNRQVVNLYKAFANHTSTNIKLSKAHLTIMQKGGFLSMLLGTFGASLLGNMVAGRGVIRGGEGTIRAGYGSKKFCFPTH